MGNETRTCFVIGPIGDSLAPVGSPARRIYEDALEVLEQVISPACAEVGLTAVRADTISVTGDLTEQIFRHLRDDDVVIADLTGANPNVMYELGLRHTIDKLTIQIGEFDSLPFDIQSIRTIQFSRSEHGLVQARKKLVGALTVGLADGGDLLPATRIWNDRIQAETEAEPEGRDPGGAFEDEDELGAPGIIDLVTEIESALPDMTSILQRVGEEVVNLGETAQSFSPDLEALNAQGGSAAARLTLIAKFGTAISEPATELESLSLEFEARMSKLDDATSRVLSIWERDDLDIEPSTEFLESMVSLAESARGGMEGLGSIVPGLKMLSALSRTLRRPASLVESAVARLMKSVQKIDDWGSRSNKLLASGARQRATEAVEGAP